jgi:hypothetical protein
LTAPVEPGLRDAWARCSDRFTDDRVAGTVLGTVGPGGAARLGVDAEGLLAIDNGALRMQPLTHRGWGREAIAYGPFERAPGLAFAAHVLNGHMASQTFYFPETRRERARRLLSDARRLRFRRREHHYENLAVGLLPAPDTTDPLSGHGFVVHAATEDNGELWGSVAGRPQRIVRGVQNLPFVFVVALRETGAAYYTASVPGAVGAAGYPHLRPVGIDTAVPVGPLYATVAQRILGEVGYHVDTRVHGVEVATVEAWSAWYGSAEGADRLTGTGPLDGRRADTGNWWRRIGDGLVRTAGGARPATTGAPGGAALEAVGPLGLGHVVVDAGRAPARVELQWRLGAGDARLAAVLDGGGCRLVARDSEGVERELAADTRTPLLPGKHTLQVADDGRTVTVHVDGQLLGEQWYDVERFADAGGMAIIAQGDVLLRDAEAHPREVPLPDALDCGAPWVPAPSVGVVDERFDATITDLDGAETPSGRVQWRRIEGTGRIALADDHAIVVADRTTPNPGRTIYTFPWDSPDYADLTLDMTIPGTARGEGHNGRCGVVFWQDADNYLVVNFFVDDVFDGASISTFYHLGGYENMYDAVWTLVRGVEWGLRCTLRCTFDGARFLACTNGEPSLVRALTDVYPDARPLRIQEVGIIVNREWGDDTGSILHCFRAGRRAPG